MVDKCCTDALIRIIKIYNYMNLECPAWIREEIKLARGNPDKVVNKEERTV